jgi:iron complex transport system substrate-binding protein
VVNPLRRRLAAAAVAAVVAVVGLGLGAAAAAKPAPRRIIAVAPSSAELLFALGLGDRVVGVGEYVAWPPEATRLPRLGGLLDPRLETVVALHPDLAVLLPSERELGERLSALGIEVLVVPHETIADVSRSARALARRAGVPAAGERFARAFERDLAPVKLAKGKPTGSGGRPRVLLVAERERGQLAQLLLAGPGTFLDELLTRAGGTNAVADSPLAWPQVSLEEVVARRPDLIIDLVGRTLADDEAARFAADWRRVPGLPAGRLRVAVVAGDWALVPGPRLPILYRELQRALLTAAPP